MDDQETINQREWENPANWKAGLFYNSARDSRIWVPKRGVRWSGWTPNFAQPQSGWLLIGLSSVPLGFVLLWILHTIDK
jgi:uncharacterized membrane protein